MRLKRLSFRLWPLPARLVVRRRVTGGHDPQTRVSVSYEIELVLWGKPL